jgi:hypothetical protein
VARLDERGRKRSRDVAQPADLDERRGLGREKEDLQRDISRSRDLMISRSNAAESGVRRPAA